MASGHAQTHAKSLGDLSLGVLQNCSDQGALSGKALAHCNKEECTGNSEWLCHSIILQAQHCWHSLPQSAPLLCRLFVSQSQGLLITFNPKWHLHSILCSPRELFHNCVYCLDTPAKAPSPHH